MGIYVASVADADHLDDEFFISYGHKQPIRAEAIPPAALGALELSRAAHLPRIRTAVQMLGHPGKNQDLLLFWEFLQLLGGPF